MANILKLQDQLKGLPDNTLVNYMQNPNGQVPQYLVLAELQRRKDMRAEFQGAKKPQTTVAEDLESEAGQGQGVAALPVPENMFQEKNMAGGGIVAFDDGGDVRGFAAGDLVGNPDWRGPAPSSDPTAALYMDRAIIAGYRKAYPRLAEKFKKDPSSLTAGELNVIKVLQERGEVPMFSTAPAANPFDVKKQLAVASDNVPVAAPTQAAPPQAPPTNLTAPPPLTPPPSGIAQLPAAPPGSAGISTKLDRASTVFTPEVMRQLEESRKPVYLDADKYVPKELTTEEAAKQVKDVQAAFGVSEKPYEEQAARLAKRGEDIEARKAQAGWEALMTAGFQMMGTKSPYFFQGLSEGGLKGLQQYTDAREKLDASQERLDAAQFSLADAQNRFRQEGSKEAAAELRDNRKEIATAKREVARDTVAADRQAKVFERDDVKAAVSDAGRVQTTNLAQQTAERNLEVQLRNLDVSQFNASTNRLIAERPTEASFIAANAQRLFPNDPDKQTEYFVKNASAASARAAGAGDNTLRGIALKAFNDDMKRSGLFNKISEGKAKDPVTGKTGPAAAREYKDREIAADMNKAPAVASAAPSAAVDFRSLPQ